MRQRLVKTYSHLALASLFSLAGLLSAPPTAHAMEGGSSYYFPGSLGSFGVALAPAPGFQVANQTFLYGASLDRAVLQGRVQASLDTFAVYDLLTVAYTFQQPVLGAQFQMASYLPIGYVELEASLEGQRRARGGSDSDFNIGDIGLIPAAFHWHTGDFHFKLMEMIFVPSGHYDVNDAVNVGRNYWGFDTSFSITWLNMKTGTEISVQPGIMFNTENPDTDYHSGNEFHLDFMLNQFLVKTFAVGFQGYYYKQITGDSGSGARLGDFQGESVGVGPGLLWLPAFAQGKLSVVGKWLHDLASTNRLNADYGQITIGYTF